MDLNSLFDWLNNWFVDDNSDYAITVSDSDGMTFDEDTKTITADFEDSDLLAEMYVRITGTMLNDGAYKLVTVTDTAITVEQELIDESAVTTGQVDYMAVPRGVRSVIGSIEGATSEDNVSAETQGSRSITYSGTGGSSIFAQYGSVLYQYRSL